MKNRTPATLLFLVLLVAGAYTQKRGASMNDVLNLSIYIDCPPTEVYEFVSDPRHLPLWAAGLAQSKVKREGDEWIVEAPFGRARVKFVPKNSFGVLDHDVQLDSGITVHNPMRVVPHGKGSEFLFTLIRQPGMSEEKFAEDKAAVQKDLKTLKNLLESNSKG
jgi:hypothetical protein